MPPIMQSPTNLSDWFSQDQFDTIFPYSKASTVFTHDGKPFWTYEDFLSAVEWMRSSPNPKYRNFATDSTPRVNLIELASFLGNFHQETGDPSLQAPYPWAWPKVEPTGAVYEGPSGGALGLIEGVVPQATFTMVSYKADLQTPPMPLNPTERRVLGVTETTIKGIIQSLNSVNQPNFGIGAGTGAGVNFVEDHLVGVAADGTLWGKKPINEIVGKVLPISQLVPSKTDPHYANLGPFSQYGGRGAIQLSYNYNYCDCSIALFGDYRLAKYPNLIITTDRRKFLGKPFYFGFPGPNPEGNNVPPQWILDSTPPARIMGWLVCFWFWMDDKRSGRTISCHEAMLQPETIGITTVNAIINNQSGLIKGTWAWKKNNYYRRICRIFGIANADIERTIVSPPNPLSKLTV